MSGVNLAPDHAAELTELLEFLNTWLSSDRDLLDASLHRYVGHPAYHIDRLKADSPGSPSYSAATPKANSSSRQQSRDPTGHDQLDKDYLHDAAMSSPQSVLWGAGCRCRLVPGAVRRWLRNPSWFQAARTVGCAGSNDQLGHHLWPPPHWAASPGLPIAMVSIVTGVSSMYGVCSFRACS